MNEILEGFTVPPRPTQPRSPGAGVTRLEVGEITVETAIPLFHAIEAARDNSIVISVDSGGGNALCSLALFELLLTHPHHVTANIIGRASSGAATVAMAADLRRISRHGRLLIHGTRASLQDATADVMRAMLTDIERVDALSVEILAGATGRPPNEVAAWRRGETSFDARAAIAAGLAHEIMA